MLGHTVPLFGDDVNLGDDWLLATKELDKLVVRVEQLRFVLEVLYVFYPYAYVCTDVYGCICLHHDYMYTCNNMTYYDIIVAIL